MTDPLGRSQVLPYLVGLSQKGHQFHLLSFEKPDVFQKHRTTVEAITKAAGISWYPMTYTKKPPVLSTVFDVIRMERKSKELIKKYGINAVHCRSYISALVGLSLKNKFNIKFIFDIRGFWADERVEGGLWNLKNPAYSIVYRYFKRKERELFIKADGIVSLTVRAAQIINKEFHVESSRIQVIPCCADLDFFTIENVKEEFVEKIKQTTKLNQQRPVLGYLGAIGTWYMLDEMLAFFKKLLQEKPNAFFLFITTEKRQSILEKARQMDIPEESLGVYAATREEVPSALSLFDISVFFIRPTFSKAASSPTKQGEIMGMGIPLICNTGIGDTDAIVEKYNCGKLVDLADASTIDHLIAGIDEVLAIPGTLIRAGAQDTFSLQQGVENYQRLYSSLGLA